MEIPLADPDVVIIFDMSSSKHSTDVKSHGHFQGLLFLISFGDLETLDPFYFPLIGNPVCGYLNLLSLVSAHTNPCIFLVINISTS